MYNEINEKIERTSKLVYTIFVEASIVGLIVPPIIITLVNYFIYDLKEQSYFLPTPVMYVINRYVYINLVNFNSNQNSNINYFFMQGSGVHHLDIL